MRDQTRLLIRWTLAAAALLVFAAVLTVLSGAFGYDREVVDMPVLVLTALLAGSGLLYAVAVPRLIEHSVPSLPATPTILTVMVAAGFAARLILFASEPALEDDYQRYLWDGAVTASGLNAYAASPLEAQTASPQSPLGQLRSQSGHVLERVNHPQFATIYPPVTQAAFALAHVIQPWSLNAWRALMLGCDAVILASLLVLLPALGRSQLWAALYWWNPLVLKETANSAHMEPLVVALVMVALVLAVKRRPFGATTVLALAAGAKLWPVLLLPLIVRPLTGEPRKLLMALAMFAGLLALWLYPIARAGFGETSGFRAYAETWQTNSALFPVLKSALSPVIVGFGVEGLSPSIVIKALLGCGLAALAIVLARRAIKAPEDLMLRSGALIAALVLVSPAQYPWYALWALPFLAFRQSKAALALSALLPLYYASFHFAARETLDTAGPYIVAAIWLPVWALAVCDFRDWRNRRSPDAAAHDRQRQTVSLNDGG